MLLDILEASRTALQNEVLEFAGRVMEFRQWRRG
jgi:hypothetical protein